MPFARASVSLSPPAHLPAADSNLACPAGVFRNPTLAAPKRIAHRFRRRPEAQHQRNKLVILQRSLRRNFEPSICPAYATAMFVIDSITAVLAARPKRAALAFATETVGALTCELVHTL